MKLLVILGLILVQAQAEDIRDSQGRLIGRINCNSYVCEGRDTQNRIRGYYYIQANETRDAQGRLLAHGNILASLLY